MAKSNIKFYTVLAIAILPIVVRASVDCSDCRFVCLMIRSLLSARMAKFGDKMSAYNFQNSWLRVLGTGTFISVDGLAVAPVEDQKPELSMVSMVKLAPSNYAVISGHDGPDGPDKLLSGDSAGSRRKSNVGIGVGVSADAPSGPLC